MEFIEHNIKNGNVVEILSDEVIIKSEQDALDIMATINYQHNSSKIIIKKENICDDFFDLKTGIAGDILQKFSNYRVQLAIIGDFSQYKSKSLKDFIYECNKNKLIVFLPEIAVALKEWV